MRRVILVATLVLAAACSGEDTPATTTTTVITTATVATTTTAPTTTTGSTTTTLPSPAMFRYGGGGDVTIDSGGDVDFEVVSVGSPAQEAVRSGNGARLPADDNNDVADFYLQFRVRDTFMFEARPTSRVRIDVEYLDVGTDSFNIQYDAVTGGPYSDGTFKDTSVHTKTNSGDLRTATFRLCDAYFGNRDNGADFRIADGNDGAETVSQVAVTLTGPAGPGRIDVDACGANPFDDLPDSDAIQACIDRTCDGDTVVFTSGAGAPGYRGYLIDKTIFLVRGAAKHGLTFTASDPADPATLVATADLAGFVTHLVPRSEGISDVGTIDDVTISHLDIDVNREERRCNGPDGTPNGLDDNWGSWLPECTIPGDSWCNPGGIAIQGATDFEDRDADYRFHPERWSTGITVRDVTISDVECGTALAFWGAAGTIEGVTIDTAGDHVHGPGCAADDPDGDVYAWADGITMAGPAHRVVGNVIRDASDIGIVTFGGPDTLLRGNTVVATQGNHGMFAGIAFHPYQFGLAAGFEVIGNEVVNEADEVCGGIHAGIDIGAHMWGAGCTTAAPASVLGSVGACSSVEPPANSQCSINQLCQVWGYVPPGATFTLADNSVRGAQVNYLVEGLFVEGELVVSGNESAVPRLTDWEGDGSCTWDGITDSWGTLEFVAHQPAIPGWDDRRIYCER